MRGSGFPDIPVAKQHRGKTSPRSADSCFVRMGWGSLPVVPPPSTEPWMDVQHRSMKPSLYLAHGDSSAWPTARAADPAWLRPAPRGTTLLCVSCSSNKTIFREVALRLL